MAAKRICSIHGCDKPHEAQSFCSYHYNKWRRRGDPLAKGQETPRGAAAHFFESVVCAYDGDDCLIWPYCRTSGYGTLKKNGRMYLVHRLACELINGPSPGPQFEAAHSCGNGHLGCCAPKHIRWATSKENKADAISHGTLCRGERITQAKLTRAQVEHIRLLKGSASETEISSMFGVSRSQIGRILRGECWAP